MLTLPDLQKVEIAGGLIVPVEILGVCSLNKVNIATSICAVKLNWNWG